MVFLREAQMTSPAMLEKSRKMLAEMIRAGEKHHQHHVLEPVH